MALDDVIKSEVRRHLEYPAIGLYRSSVNGMTLADGAAGYRYFTGYGALEWRMNNLMPDEEARINGFAFASIAITGTPVNGDVIAITFSGGGLANPVTINTTVAGMLPNPQHDSNIINQNALTVTQEILIAVLGNAALVAAGFMVVAPYGAGPFSQRFYPNPIITFQCPSGFRVAVTGPANEGLQVRQSGAPLSPSFTANAGSPSAQTFNGFVPILNQLEAAQAGSSDNLDTIRADVWWARADEIKQRALLYRQWQHKLAIFLNVPMGSESGASSAKGIGGGGMPRLRI